MSAASPKPEDKAQEPSMEEILASIRRIIADDQAPKASETPEPDPFPEPGNDDVLDLAEVAQPVRKPPPAIDEPEIDFREAEPTAEIDFDAIDFDPPPVPSPKPAERIEADDRLTSNTTGDSVGRAFNLLAHTVLTHNTRTLEDLVQDMLRPMLKEWLDDNLPSMVERLVRIEIERVARGR